MTDATISVGIETRQVDEGVKALNRAVRSLTQAVNTNSNTVAAASARAYSGFARSVQQASNAVKKGTVENTAYTKRMQDLARAVRLVDGPLGGVASRFQTLGEIVRSNTARMAAFALSLSTVIFAMRELVQRGDEFTRVSNKLKLVTDSAAELNRVRDGLFGIAKATYQSIGAVTDIYFRFARANDKIGASAAELREVTEGVAKAVAITGGNVQSTNAALFQFSQGLAANRFAGQELNSVMEQAPEIIKAMERGLVAMGYASKTSEINLRQLAKDGVLTAVVSFRAIQIGLKETAEKFDKFSPTATQAMSTLSMAFTELLGKINRTYNVSGTLAEGVLYLSRHLEDLAKVIKIGVTGAVIGMTAIMTGALASALKNTIGLMLSLTVMGIRAGQGMAGLSLAMSAGAARMGVLAKGMGVLNPLYLALGAAVYYLYTQYEELNRTVNMEEGYRNGHLAFLQDQIQFTGALTAETRALTEARLADLKATVAMYQADILTREKLISDQEKRISGVSQADLRANARTGRGDTSFGDYNRLKENVARAKIVQEEARTSLKETFELIEKIEEALKDGYGGAGPGKADEAAQKALEKKKEFLQSLKEELIYATKLNEAAQISKKNYEEVKMVLDAQNKVRDSGNKLSKEEYDAAVQLVLATERVNAATKKGFEEQDKAEKDRKKRLKDMERDQKKLEDAAAKPFENAAERIQNSFSDVFYEIFNEGKLSFESLASSIKSIFARLAAETLTLNLTSSLIGPLAMGATGLFGASASTQDKIGQQFGISSGGGGGFGNLTSLASIGRSLSGSSLSGSFAGNLIDKAGSFFGLSGGAIQGPTLPVGPLGPVAPGQLGNAGISTSFTPGAALAGMGGNFLANSIFGSDRGIGATIGGTVGGIGGTLATPAITAALMATPLAPLAPFIGPAIGSFLGNAFGGLFGGKPSNKGQFGSLDLSTNQAFDVGGLTGSKFSQENSDARDALLALVQQLDKAIDSNTGAVKISVGNREGLELGFDGEKLKSFGGDTKAFNEALVRGLIERTPDIAEGIKLAVEKVDFTNLEEVVSDLTFAAGYDNFFGLIVPSITQSESAMISLNQQIKDLTDTVVRLGLNEERLNDVRKDTLSTLRNTFDQSIQDRILGSTNPAALQLKQLNAEYDLIRREAIAVGGDLNAIEMAYQTEREALVKASLEASLQEIQRVNSEFQKYIDSITQFQNNLALDANLSGTNRLGRSNEASRQIQDLIGRVSGGDVEALDGIDGTLQKALEASLDYYGPTMGYLSTLDDVKRLLEDGKKLAESKITPEQESLAQLQQQTILLQQLVDQYSVQDFGANPSVNKQLASLTGFSGDFGSGGFARYMQAYPEGAVKEAARAVVRAQGWTPQFADGTGMNRYMGDAIVGERGPELASFGRPAQIFSNAQTQAMFDDSSTAEQVDKYRRQSEKETQYLGKKLDAVASRLGDLSDEFALFSRRATQ